VNTPPRGNLRLITAVGLVLVGLVVLSIRVAMAVF
jgi:hypothetical protein